MAMKIHLTSKGLFPTYLIVTARINYGRWNVKDIEIYSRPDYSLDSLLADDCWYRLPPSSIDAIHAALNEWELEQRKEEREVRQIMEGM